MIKGNIDNTMMREKWMTKQDKESKRENTEIRIKRGKDIRLKPSKKYNTE